MPISHSLIDYFSTVFLELDVLVVLSAFIISVSHHHHLKSKTICLVMWCWVWVHDCTYYIYCVLSRIVLLSIFFSNNVCVAELF